MYEVVVYIEIQMVQNTHAKQSNVKSIQHMTTNSVTQDSVFRLKQLLGIIYNSPVVDNVSSHLYR